MPPLLTHPPCRSLSTHHNLLKRSFEALTVRQDGAATSATSVGPSSSTVGGITASDLIQKAEEHWNVSAKSILAAWALTAIGSLLIILAYSAVRLRWKLIYLPRLKVHKSSLAPGKKLEDEKDKAVFNDLKATKEKESKEEKKKSKEEKKKLEKEKEKNEPEYYPIGDNDPGRWLARAPRSEIGYFGWLKPTWREISVEIKSVMPKCLHLRKMKNKGEESSSHNAQVSLFEQDKKTLHMLGLDAVIYLIFLRTLKYLFTVISILASFLAYINYLLNTRTSYGGTSAITSNNQDQLQSSDTNKGASSSTMPNKGNANNTSVINNPQLLTAANVTSNGLLIHISFEWIVTMLVIVFVLKANYNEVSFKTVMITNLDIKPDRKKNIHTVADAKEYIKSHVLGIQRDNTQATVWFAIHNMNPLHEKMEDFKNKYLQWAIKAAIKDVAMETDDHPGTGVFYDSCASAMCGKSELVKNRIQKAIDKKKEIEDLQEQIRNDQIDVTSTVLRGSVTSAFVTVPTAREAREIIKNRKERLKAAEYHVQRAPRSHNVLWRNLEKDAKSRHSHAIIGKVALVIICFINTIPLIFITVLANMGTTINRWPALAKLAESSLFWKAVFTVLAGVLPATISAMFSYLLPYIMRRLSRWSGALTRGQLDKTVIRQLFVFLLVSNFIVFSLLGVIYETYLTIAEDVGKESWSTIYASLGNMPAKITRAYISESSYWLSWYPIRSIVACIQLLQIPRLLLKAPRLLLMKTPHDLAEIAQPERFEFAIEYSHVLFAMVVGLMYAPLAPLVVICASIYFWTVFIIHTNQLKYVFDSKETDGKSWKVIINRVLIATVFMQLLMVLTVTLKTKSAPMAVGAALPIGIIFLFKMYMKRHYHPDGELFSKYIDKYEYEEKVMLPNFAPEYEHELLKDDWMPKFKVAKQKKFMGRAFEKFPALKTLLEKKQLPTPIRSRRNKWGDKNKREGRERKKRKESRERREGRKREGRKRERRNSD
nr:hypothetical protein L203_05251 [Cryptococcus depauperatus CBS 7841]